MTSYDRSKSIEKRIRFRNIDNATILHDVSSRYQPFPTTPLQEAYLIGRSGHFELGQVSCFVYEEYDCAQNFDILRLETAFNRLIQRHEALRIIFPSESEQRILEHVPYYAIIIVDLNQYISIDEQLMKRRIDLSTKIVSRVVGHFLIFS